VCVCVCVCVCVLVFMVGRLDIYMCISEIEHTRFFEELFWRVGLTFVASSNVLTPYRGAPLLGATVRGLLGFFWQLCTSS
jgi:hypothetical protein